MREVDDMFTYAVECPCCHAVFTENWSDYIVSTDVTECEMGTETEYSIECDEFECPECGKKLRIAISVWEYPQGAYNYHEIRYVTPVDD